MPETPQKSSGAMAPHHRSLTAPEFAASLSPEKEKSRHAQHIQGWASLRGMLYSGPRDQSVHLNERRQNRVLLKKTKEAKQRGQLLQPYIFGIADSNSLWNSARYSLI